MILKKYSLLTLVLFFTYLLGIAQNNNTYYIVGNLSHSLYDGQKIYLNKLNFLKQRHPIVIDSAIISANNFVIKGTLADSLSIATLTIQDNDTETVLLALEQGIIHLDFSSNPSIKGTKKNEELTTFNQKLAKLQKQNLKLIQKKLRSKSPNNTIQHQIDILDEKQNLQLYDFIKTNINNEIGQYYFIKEFASLNTSQLETLYNSSPKKFQKSRVINRIMQRNVWNLGDLRIGKTFETITLNDAHNKSISMDSLIRTKKIILVDFWASWCGPCLKNMPELSELYKKYAKNGFEIIGVSLDNSKDSWINACSKRKLSWPQLIDDAGNFKGTAATKYQIKGLPQTYLLDSNKKIIGVDLRGYKLEEAIKKAISQK